MKLDQLRKIIREEVKNAVKEELQDILNEAVKIASEPSGKKVTYEKPISTKQNNSSLTEMLNQTKASMTSQEYRNVFAGTSDMVSKPNFASSMASSMGMQGSTANQPGLDISQLDFVKKAGDVYNAAVEKDKQKRGLV